MDEAAQYDYAAFLRAITLLAMMLDACLRLGTSGVGISPSATLFSGVIPRHAEAAARQTEISRCLLPLIGWVSTARGML